MKGERKWEGGGEGDREEGEEGEEKRRGCVPERVAGTSKTEEGFQGRRDKAYAVPARHSPIPTCWK